MESEKQVARSATSAMQHFRNLDKKAAQDSECSEVGTLHQNSISQLSAMDSDLSGISRFSSSGMDGALVIWSSQS
ncbi:actin-related protein 2/3 complex subunit 1A-B-like [Dendrobates tinctorius]|uniref:actin-related protein 2/3 complex subunit 1A-B-like n=1 Tax=Dendrobates tinctorius TaxID=92724 RepID=UPI003CC93E11